MEIRFLHTADVHLKRDEPSRLDILSWIISKVRELNAGLIIAGDLFESDTEASFLRDKVRGILEKTPQDLPILIIPGNHDYHSYSLQTYYGNNVILFPEVPSPVNLEGVEVLGVPFHPGKEFSRYVEEYYSGAEFDLIIAHGTLFDKSFPNIYKELGEDAKYMPIYSWDVGEKIKAGCLALGHYHSRFTHLIYGRTQLVYPGSPIATSKRALGMRFLSLISISRKGEIRVEKVPVEPSCFWEKREWMVFPGKEEEKLAQVEKDIEGLSNKKLMLLGEIKGSITMSEKEIREKVKKIEEKYRAKFHQLELSVHTIYWADLLENPTLALFVEKLNLTKEDEPIKERALELTLRALDELRV